MEKLAGDFEQGKEPIVKWKQRRRNMEGEKKKKNHK